MSNIKLCPICGCTPNIEPICGTAFAISCQSWDPTPNTFEGSYFAAPVWGLGDTKAKAIADWNQSVDEYLDRSNNEK